jgi:hypothetical protein
MAAFESHEQPDAEFHHLLAEFHAQEQARVDRAKNQLRDVILPRLKQWGVSKVEAQYSGYGDSGSIDGVSYLDAAGEPVSMNLVRSASDPDIESVVYEFLPAGFEINDGGQGTLTIDVQAGTVTLSHAENEVISHESRREFTLQ